MPKKSSKIYFGWWMNWVTAIASGLPSGSCMQSIGVLLKPIALEFGLSRAAASIAAAYYGTPPEHAYWSGCSLGGMQGFNAAHHFPEDYDGIIVGGSGNPFALINAAQHYPAWQIAKDPARFIPESKYAMIHEAVIKACDGLDGITDGVLDDPRACPFDPKQLQCQGPDSPDCLTPPQVAK